MYIHLWYAHTYTHAYVVHLKFAPWSIFPIYSRIMDCCVSNNATCCYFHCFTSGMLKVQLRFALIIFEYFTFLTMLFVHVCPTHKDCL